MSKSKAMPSVELGMAAAAKVGSILVHVEEVIETDGGHPFDIMAMQALLSDRQVQAFIGQLRAYALVPVKRSEKKQTG